MSERLFSCLAVFMLTLNTAHSTGDNTQNVLFEPYDNNAHLIPANAATSPPTDERKRATKEQLIKEREPRQKQGDQEKKKYEEEVKALQAKVANLEERHQRDQRQLKMLNTLLMHWQPGGPIPSLTTDAPNLTGIVTRCFVGNINNPSVTERLGEAMQDGDHLANPQEKSPSSPWVTPSEEAVSDEKEGFDAFYFVERPENGDLTTHRQEALEEAS
ncbi:hypothetical protein [Candidatus Hepatobacter penaei]|uniref:hypothetical protein n=1 Tax=Candidatus Hepatobacter penaei TaxID=1274402 RepID=UPI0012E054A7|nr:hypothetical protein [Candidatus Hepatobacter penaei]